ncbi:MAG: DUF4178 domain-containing protein [Bdellovibrio sp.]|nr:DUF4178 domain-containing protein [Bdellovibrio sp.]
MTFLCPSCSAEIQFSSSVALYCVCRYCRSQIFRNEQQVDLLGKQAELPEDVSPVQIFSEGEAFGKKFRVLGKVKMQWAGGTWNEWFLTYSDGTLGWLAEAQGKWILSTEKKEVVFPDLEDIRVGRKFTLDSVAFIYTDKKEATSYGFEGELPFLTVAGEKRFSVDLLSDKSNRFLSFEYSKDERKAFIGKYVTLTELKMTNLKQIEGFSA